MQAAPEAPLTVIPPTARPAPTALDHRILEHEPIGGRHMRLVLEARRIAEHALPGQFVMLSIPSGAADAPVLPRPMAIFSVDHRRGSIEILYAIVGTGTAALARCDAGGMMHVVGPLGQPFVVPETTRRVLLVGRGIGTCSLTTVAQQLPSGVRFDAVTSSRETATAIGVDLYREHGAEKLYVISDEGGDSNVVQLGARLRADLGERPPDVIMTCGSRRLEAMCRELGESWGADVQVSVEAHMACGLGYCHGCATGQRAEGEESPLVCRDGPVFRLAGTSIES